MGNQYLGNGLKYQNGVTLLEALISIVILSVGILGLAGFQYKVMQNSQIAKTRAIASYYAEELIGNAATDPGNISTKYVFSNNDCVDNGSDTFCTSWHNRVKNEIPNVDEVATTYTANTGTFDVTISWKNRPADTTVHSYTTSGNMLTVLNPNATPVPVVTPAPTAPPT